MCIRDRFVNNAFKILPRHALHAKSLGFVHPTSGEEMLFESDLPTDFQECIDKWRKYVHTRKEIVEKEIADEDAGIEDSEEIA